MQACIYQLKEEKPKQLYLGKKIAFLTQHGKELYVGEILSASLGCTVEKTNGFDTDLLGTFTREIPRQGSQLSTARRKASLAMSLSGYSIAIGSEGAFGHDPYCGQLPWNKELLVFQDASTQLEVVGFAQGPACYYQRVINDWEDMVAYARQAKFPGHHLTVRTDDAHSQNIRKGINSWPELESAFQLLMNESRTQQVFAENDVRAHCNPTRQHIISEAARDLAQRVSSACPCCNTPGYWKTKVITGLACSICGHPTNQAKGEQWECSKCGHREVRQYDNIQTGDPTYCNICNP